MNNDPLPHDHQPPTSSDSSSSSAPQPPVAAFVGAPVPEEAQPTNEPSSSSFSVAAHQPFTPAPATAPADGVNQLLPQPVVQVLSPRGVEYIFLAIALFTGAIGLGGALLSLVNGETSFSVLAFPTAVLLVAVPIFAALFLRLKKAELDSPDLRLDASKRRTTQFIQIASFVVCFFTLIGFVVTIFSKMSGDYGGSMVKVFLDVLVILVIAGGILTYYWRDEHQSA